MQAGDVRHDVLARVTALISVLALCAGCAAGNSATQSIPASHSAGAAAVGVSSAEYVLGTGDKVKVNVFGEDNLTGEYEIGASGMIEMPLVGQVKAAGLSTKAFGDSLGATLRSGGYLRDPKVSAEVLTYRPFFILGEVTKAGEYPYRNGMNVMSAVATAGGFTYRANTRTVQIQRGNEVVPRNYPVATSVVILPGDILTVQERYF